MESESAEEATDVLEAKDLNLEMCWQLKKWPSLPSLLNRSPEIYMQDRIFYHTQKKL